MKKKLIFKVLIVATIVLFLSVLLWANFSSNKIKDLPEILEDGRLTIVTDSSSLGFITIGDSIYGFQYEIVKAFADTLGVELVVVEENNMNNAIGELMGGGCDLLANFIPVTTEYQNDLLFSEPFEISRQVLVQRVSVPLLNVKVSSQYELAGDTIHIPKSSPNILRIKHLSDEIADTIHFVEMQNISIEQMVKLVALGEIKQTVCSERLARKMKLDYPQIDYSLAISFSQKHSWVVNAKSPLLLERLNVFLTDFIGSSVYWEIYRKYY